jgi:hypothetical protein
VDREERRYRAQRIAEQRFREYWSVREPRQKWRTSGAISGVIHLPVGHYRKVTSFGGHHCSKKTIGRPHYGTGICHYEGTPRPTVIERHRARKVIEEALDLA